MNALFAIEGVGLWQTAGWTMLHFLWLGAIVGLVAVMARLLLRRAAPNVRYGVALAVLALLGALPIGIAAWLVNNPPAALPLASPSSAPKFAVGLPLDTVTRGPIIELSNREPSQPLESALAAPGLTGGYPVALDMAAGAGSVAPRKTPFTLELALARLELCVPYLPWLWLIGTPLTFLLLATGLIGAERLRRASRVIVDCPIADAAARLLHTLRISRRVTVAVCERIAAPVLVGIVRPIILLPPAALTGWSPDDIEMVLLHELAHVRRWDNLVNLAQRCLESLLFFHPAVWLVSNWVRREREACCDAVVVARTNRPHAYAEMLVALAAQMPRSVLFHPAASSAMAAGPLRARIRHILQLEEDPMLVSGKSFAMVLGSVVVAATLAVLYLPTLGQAEESPSHNSATAGSTTEDEEELAIADSEKATSAAEVESQQKLKQLMLALHNYHDTYKKFPAFASVDANGKPLLSWRVLILPLLGEVKLYEEFRLNEPWNSEHNRKLIARMPDVFKSPKLGEPGMTNYLAVVGRECVFDGSPKGFKLSQIADGTAITLALVEANADQSVAWTKPQDWRFDRWHPTAGLGSLWGDHWYGAFVDGSVRRNNNTEPAEEVGIQFTRAGGEHRRLSESEGQGLQPGLAGPTGAEIAGAYGEGGAMAMGGGGMIGPASDPAAFASYGASPPSAPGKPTRKFPSLEDQKLADLAWKRLGIELEQISGDDLNRVQAVGFEGGLKVTSTGIELQQQQQRQQGIHKGDILVGLHVWSTTNLKQVAEVLNRDDLAELNPLKYYVVRLGLPLRAANEYRAGDGPPEVDTVLSGRLNVQSDRTTRGRQSSTEPSPAPPWPTIGSETAPPQPGPTRPDPFPTAPTPNSPPALSTAPTPSAAALADRYVAPTPADSNEWDAQPQPRIPAGEPASSVAKVLPGTPRATRVPRSAETVEPGPAEENEREQSVLVPTRPLASAPANQTPAPPHSIVWTPGGGVLVDPSVPPTPAQGKALLRYDGKTFGMWTNAWRTELSTEKRLEAVKALAAFGRAGYGKEAADAILDVAGEYDFYVLEGEENEEGKLKNTVLAELAPNYRSHLLAKYWVPDLAIRLEKEPKKWQWLAVHLLNRLKTDDPEVIAVVQSLAQNGPSGVSSAALGALARSNQSSDGVRRFDDKTRELVAEKLKSDDLVAVSSAMSLLLYYPQAGGGGGFGGGASREPKLILLPELVPLLFHADEGIRKQARRTLHPIDEKDAPQVVQELSNVLKDASRSGDHVEAIRALAAMGPKAQSAVPTLRKILADSSEDSPLRFAAAVALYSIDNSNYRKMLAEALGRELEIELNENGEIYWRSEPKSRLFEVGFDAESAEIFPPENPGQGGGGGGGGGGGFF